MPEITAAGDSFADEDILDDLPLQLVKSEVIPPVPNLTGSAIDFLPDFAGYGWLAYGAASLFVISHFSSPASPLEKLIGPIMRQAFELDGFVNVVAWSPVTPSTGEVAVAADNYIALYSHDSEGSTGSFRWSQNAVLAQDTKVNVVEWTGSGDGIVVGGAEVVLWKNNNRSWEVVWKFRNELPQDLISTTWSIKGPLAAAAAYREGDDGSSAADSKDNLGNAYLTSFFATGAWDHSKLLQSLKAYQNAEKDERMECNPDLYYNCAIGLMFLCRLLMLRRSPRW